MSKMNLTIQELKEKLSAYYDEVSLLELLNIHSDELLDRFEDRVEQHYDRLIEEFEEEEEIEDES